MRAALFYSDGLLLRNTLSQSSNITYQANFADFQNEILFAIVSEKICGNENSSRLLTINIHPKLTLVRPVRTCTRTIPRNKLKQFIYFYILYIGDFYFVVSCWVSIHNTFVMSNCVEIILYKIQSQITNQIGSLTLMKPFDPKYILPN